jgi:hypothetical protein
MNLTSRNVAEAITSLIPCGASILDLRSDENATPIEHILPYGCRYIMLPRAIDSLSSQYLKIHRIDCLILDILGELSASLNHVCRLVVELGLMLILEFDFGLFNAFVANTIKPFGLASRNSEQTGSQHITRLEHLSTTDAIEKKRVLVLSCAGWPNFGDRLGFHLIHGCLPPSVSVQHIYFPQMDVDETDYDLLVLWLGTSVFNRTLTKDILRLMDRVPHVVGIFGTQYRRSIDPAMMAELLGRLSFWYARYEEDLYLYGRGTRGIHLGDWLIDAFPLTQALNDGLLSLGPDLISREVPLDRLIQRIQSCKRVSSARLHPLLCALTSAEEVSYREQREFLDGETSGKFRSLFLDVFGRDYPEGRFFTVDRHAVVAYKESTSARITKLRENLSNLLGEQRDECGTVQHLRKDHE